MKKIIAANPCSVGFILNGVLCSLLPSLCCQVTAALKVTTSIASYSSKQLVEIFNQFSDMSGTSFEDKLSHLGLNKGQIEAAQDTYKKLIGTCKKSALPGMKEFLRHLHKKGYTTFTTTANDKATAEAQTQAVGLHELIIKAKEDGQKPHLNSFYTEKNNHVIVIFDAISEHEAAKEQFDALKIHSSDIHLSQIGFVVHFTHEELLTTFDEILNLAKIKIPDLTKKNLEAAKLDGFQLKPDTVETIFDYSTPDCLEDLLKLVEVKAQNKSLLPPE